MTTIKIQQYDRQVSPQSRGATPQMNLVDVSSGMESIGRGIEQIGDAVERKRLDDDAVAISKIQSEAEVQWSDWMNQTQDSWKRGSKELPAQFFDSFDKWQKEATPALQTREGKRIFDERMRQFRTVMGKSAVGWQASTNEKLKLLDLGEVRENMKKTAAANPALAEMVASRFVSDTESMILSPEQRQEQQIRAKNEVAFAAEIGLLDKAAEAWGPDDKRWSWGNLTFEQQERLKSIAEQQKRDREADARNKRNAQEQADHAVAKDITDAKLQGFKVSPAANAQAAAITAAYKDKPWAAALAGANKYADEARTMAQWPIQEQQKVAAQAAKDVSAIGAKGVVATDVVPTEKGNIDILHRKAVPFEGGIATVRSISIEEDGKEVLIPTVINGAVVSDEEAIAYYKKTGQHLGKFKTSQDADKYAEALHQQQASLASDTQMSIGVAVDRARFLAQRFQDNAKRIVDDPYSYYEDVYGHEIQPLNRVDPLPAQIDARKEAAFVVRAATGVNPGVLRPQEAPQFAEMLAKASPDEALAVINQLAAGDQETAKATFDQLGKAIPAYGVAGKMQATGAKLADGRMVGSVMLTGHKALEAKAVKFKKPSDIDSAISEEVGEMFANAPGEYETARDAVKWLLAGKAVASGSFDYEPTSGDINDAIQEVINPVTYQGGKVSAPVGTDPSDFDEVVEQKIEAAIAAASMSDENKRLLASRHRLLDSSGDGVYELAWSSGVRVLDAQGYPIKVFYK